MIKAFLAVGDKQEHAWDGAMLDTEVEGTSLPLASFPWNQSWVVLPSHMLGRFLRAALTFCSRDSSTRMSKVVFKLVEVEPAQLNTSLLAAPGGGAGHCAAKS